MVGQGLTQAPTRAQTIGELKLRCTCLQSAPGKCIFCEARSEIEALAGAVNLVATEGPRGGNGKVPLAESVLREQVEGTKAFGSINEALLAMNGMTTRDLLLFGLRCEQLGYQRGLVRALATGVGR